jgi:2-succinyl-5-enolpyruvyl-6-hydroxy-3-cyclohexene-1-carboxylate synthase
MLKEAPNINHQWAQLIVEELVRQGVRRFCVSPGSRSTPLAWAVGAHARADSWVHFDERGAAFHALGMAKALHEPVALVCTSGTAVANVFPAVVEASQSLVPLILLTADRPPELIDTGANQTIDQTKIFGDYVRWQTVLPAPDPAVAPETVLTAVDHAVFRARRSPAGPVHVNSMYREPLAPTATGFDAGGYLTYLHGWVHGDAPYTRYTSATACDEETSESLAQMLNGVMRGLLLVGQLDRAEDVAGALALAGALGWPVFPDVTSGLRLGDHSGLTVHNYEQLLLSAAFADRLRPQLILHVGGAITSKRLLGFLERHPDLPYVLVAPHPRRHDPAHRVRRRIEADIADLAAAVVPRLKARVDEEWHQWLFALSLDVQQTVGAHLRQAGMLSEMAVARRVSKLLPEDSVLFLGNSMPIRDMNMYGAHNGARVRVAANRGASGIDGNVATAAGYANALERPVTAIIGDLALLHDLNSLALLRTTKAPVVVVVINNNGGGIFSFLPIADHREHFEQYFGTPHGLRFANVAAMFDLAYVSPDTPRAFADAYHSAIHGARSVLIEVITDREENVRVHRELQGAIRARIER